MRSSNIGGMEVCHGDAGVAMKHGARRCAMQQTQPKGHRKTATVGTAAPAGPCASLVHGEEGAAAAVDDGDGENDVLAL